MKIIKILILIGFLFTFINNSVLAQQKKQHKNKNTQVFIDKDGDGYNDNAPDHDGDGIPNGLDPDWKKGHGRKINYIDADGDGINDLIQNSDQTVLQNIYMNQNRSNESIMDTDQVNQKGHQKGRGNK